MAQSLTMTISPQRFLGHGGHAFLERNTFLDFCPPPLDIQKAWSDPLPTLDSLDAPPAHKAASEPGFLRLELTQMPSAPPPLDLEFFATPDMFEDAFDYGLEATPTLNVQGTADNRFDEGLDSTSVSSFFQRPPPMSLPLERIETYDEFAHPEPHLEEAGCHEGSVQGSQDPDIVLATALSKLRPGGKSFGMWIPPPPASPAPVLAEPRSPNPPLAPPVEGAEAPPAAGDLPLNALTCEMSAGGSTHVHWSVDARKLFSTVVRVVSPQFMLDLPGHGPQPFKVSLLAKDIVNNKRGGGFKRAKGKGSILLKCEAQFARSVPDVTFSIRVGRGGLMQPPRGPVTNNFSEKSCVGLAEGNDEWDFRSIADEFGSLIVSLHIAPFSTSCSAR